MKRRKVLHLITHLGFGGAQDNTLLTVERLDRGRFEVHLGAGSDYPDWVPRGREAADAYFTFPDLCRAPGMRADLRALRRLTAFLRSHRYDIVHTHSAKAGTIGRLAARRAGVPVVIHTFHSFGWQAADGHHTGPLDRARSAAKKWVFIQLERFVAARSDALITVCNLNRREAIDLALAPPEKLTTVYSGIDLARFEARLTREQVCRELGLDPCRPVVGAVGRLATQKAPLDLVRAAQLTLARRPDAQFVLVGDGPLADDVQRAIHGDDRIRVLGYQDDVPKVLSVLDVFAQASLWEGLGRAATEAMIMGVPVAATAVDGVPELVEHGTTGLLSPPREPDALAEHVLWLLDHPDEARRMGERGRDRVVPAFSVETMVAGIEDLYEACLAPGGAPAKAAAGAVLSGATARAGAAAPPRTAAPAPLGGEPARREETLL